LRLEKDGQFVELWLDEVRDRFVEFASRVLRSREGAIGDSPEPVTLATRFEFSAADDLQRLLGERLRAGWQRVRDPEREENVDGEPRDPALDAALLADPSDSATALVYADWLQQRGHPRGALIALQHANLDDEAAQLLDEHEDDLLGPLASYLDSDGSLELTWELGFVRRARIGRRGGDSGPQVLWEVLRHPSTRLLRELVIGHHRLGDQNNELMCDLLLHAGPRPTLRLLEIADFDQSELDNIDISRAPIGDLSQLSARYPLLEDVVLKGNGDVALGNLDLPRARRFALRTSGMTRATLATIARAKWPALRELELWFGDPERGYGAQCERADAAALFRCELPELRVLALRNAMFSDEIVPDVLSWAGAVRLEELDFALGTLSDDGARQLIAGKHALPSLRRLGVFECALSPRGMQELRDAGFTVDDRPIAPAFAWREPQQKAGRYASVSE